MGVGKRSRRLGDHQIPKPPIVMPDWQRDIDQRVHALVLLHNTDQYSEAEDDLLNDLANRPAQHRSFAAAALSEQWRKHHRTLHDE